MKCWLPFRIKACRRLFAAPVILVNRSLMFHDHFSAVNYSFILIMIVIKSKQK